MEIGLIAPFVSPLATAEFVARYGQVAEACGFASIWVAEHVVTFDAPTSRYPYSDDGRMPASGENGFLEPFAALSFLAAETSAIRLGTGVCVLPQRNPVQTAKEAATLDWLSGGRLDFGIGVGWQREEFLALEAPFAQRGARCAAYLEVVRSCWTEPVSCCRNGFYTLGPCRLYPKPVQQPHPPIYVGGESLFALRRVAEYGQGWFALNLEPDDLPPRLAQLDGLLAAAGRSRASVQLAVSPYFAGCDLRKLERYAELGVDQLILPGVALSSEAIPQVLESLAASLGVPARSPGG